MQDMILPRKTLSHDVVATKYYGLYYLELEDEQHLRAILFIKAKVPGFFFLFPHQPVLGHRPPTVTVHNHCEEVP